MSMMFKVLSIFVGVAVSVRLLFDIGTVACKEPYVFSAPQYLFVVIILIVFWGLGFLSGKEDNE